MFIFFLLLSDKGRGFNIKKFPFKYPSIAMFYSQVVAET